MGELIIRELDDATLVQLKRRAWEQGLPLAESVRRLVIESVRRCEGHDAAGVILMSPARLREAIRSERIDRRVALHS